jgi:hypothetical protein
MLTFNNLNDVPDVRHAFFTREGGVSQGVYASLNCGPGSSDSPEAVIRNRAIAMEMLDRQPQDLVTVRQAHTADVVVVERAFSHADAPTADAMVTDRPGLVLGILTADCAPVLLADKKGKVVAAAHAGWKGALGGVLDNTLKAMIGMGAKQGSILAVVGPCISQRSYEVGPDFPAPFLAQDASTESYFVKASKPGHFMFDLKGYVLHRLRLVGVTEAFALPADTCNEEQRFFSYRRTTLRKESDYGRQLSAIVIDR